MRTKRICIQVLSLLLLFSLLAGCSRITQEDLTPAVSGAERPAGETAETAAPAEQNPAPEEQSPAAGEQNPAPAEQEPQSGEPQPAEGESSPAPEEGGESAPDGISLPGGVKLPVAVTLSGGSYPSDAKELTAVITAAPSWKRPTSAGAAARRS